MGLKEEVKEMKSKVAEVKSQSLAMELLSDYKKANKRQFIIILLILTMWFLTMAYLVYVLNDIETVETTQQIEGVNTIENSNVNNGDVYGENSPNN